MANTRDAIDTLRGYYYQFDYFILKLLTIDNDDTVTLEGIEDVDIKTATETTAVQCKYYAGTEYNHSIIAKPIQQMLHGFIHNGNKLKYKLYGSYKSGTNKLVLPLTLDFVKEHFLTYSTKGTQHKFHIDEGISDAQITDFINNLEIDINADSYEQQENNVYDAIKNTFNANNENIQEQYYNKALGIVRQFCIEHDIAKRAISKRLFVEILNNNTSETFDAWCLFKKGKVKYCRLMRSRYFTLTNVSPIKRFFLIETSAANVSTIIPVLKQIKSKYSKFKPRVDHPYCPYIYLHGISEPDKKIVLQTLFEDDLIIKDGYNYKGADFNAQTLASNIQQDQRVDIKFLHSIDDMNQVLALIRGSKQVFQFYISSPFYDNNAVNNVKICITEINDINSIV